MSRSQWRRDLRRKSAAARLLRSWDRIPPAAWMFVLCECCVVSSRGLCDELITRPQESYRLWCVIVCDLETSRMKRLWPALGRSATAKKKVCKWQYTRRHITLTLLILRNHICDSPYTQYKCVNFILPFKTRIKSHLLFAGIIRSSPFSPR